MNKLYEEGRQPLFSNPGNTERKQYVWAKNEKGEKYLQETTPIDVQAEIESYADECDIKNIVRKASFDPQFLEKLQDNTGAEMDISEWPTNIHEYHRMMATAEVKAMELQKLQAEQTEVKEEKQNEQE